MLEPNNPGEYGPCVDSLSRLSAGSASFLKSCAGVDLSRRNFTEIPVASRESPKWRCRYFGSLYRGLLFWWHMRRTHNLDVCWVGTSLEASGDIREPSQAEVGMRAFEHDLSLAGPRG